jgi:hypothetical protein
MWVFCGGMFRSGSTVQYQIASHLVEHCGRGRRITWHSPDEFDSVRRTHAAEPGMLVFKAHGLTAAMREELDRRGVRVITVHRDIRDVVVSALRKNGWTFRHVWKNGYLQRWTRRFEEWAALPGALVSRYENLVEGLGDEARRIAGLLELPADDGLVAAVASEYAIDRQRERLVDIRTERAHGIRKKFDPHSLLHFNHVASGEVGIFRHALAPAEIRAIEDACREWLDRWGYARADVELSVADRLRRWSLGRRAA